MTTMPEGEGTATRATRRDHPDRGPALAEIHARPISRIDAPARVRRLAFLFGPDPDALQAARKRLEAFCQSEGYAAPGDASRRFSFATPTRRVTWEVHTEFYTVTWIAAPDDGDAWPSDIGLQAADGDRVIVATRVDVIAAATIHAAAMRGFDEVSLCYSDIEQGKAQLATDFLLDASGFTRYELAAGSVGPYLLGSIVRRVLEIETYRVLALVGIELARSVSPQLNALEARLKAAMGAVGSDFSGSDSHQLLESLHDLQVEATRLAESTRYRFSASQAYGEILRRRLVNLDERALADHRTLQRYLNHRIDPALSTFRAIDARQAALFEQIARVTAMLGTRISLDIQNQNRAILETISETGKSQYRLQGTVEGLSTIAVTYYLLGIIGYALHVLEPRFEHEKTVAVAILAPLVLLSVWLVMRRIRRH